MPVGWPSRAASSSSEPSTGAPPSGARWLQWDPPHRVVLTWHPGQDADAASEVEVRFTASEGGGTRVELEHRGWERFGESAMLRRHGYVGPGAWGHVLDHFADVADARPDAVTSAPVAGAYERSSPRRSGWVRRRRRRGVGCRPGPRARRPQRPRDDGGGPGRSCTGAPTSTFGNVTCQDPQVLTDWVAQTGDLAPLVVRGRELAATAMPRRLGSTPTSSRRRCRAGCSTTARRARRPDAVGASRRRHPGGSLHLPAHTGQLRDLRP